MDDSMKRGAGMSIFSDPDVTRIGQPRAERAKTAVQLPLRLLLVSDLTPQASAPDWAGSSQLARVDKNSFASFLQQLSPRLSIEVSNKITESPKILDVELTFSSVEDFHPEQVAKQVPALAQLQEIRSLVDDLRRGDLGLDAFRVQLRETGVDHEWADQLYRILSAPEREEAPPAPPAQRSQDDNAVDRLLSMVDLDGSDEREKPSPKEKSGGSGFMNALVQAVTDTPDAAPRAEKPVADVFLSDIDEIISSQINAVLGHPTFRHLEAAWRGLKLLIDRIDFRKNIELDVLPAGKDALSEALYYQVLLPEHSEKPERPPLSAVILDFSFGNKQEDVDLLEDLAETGASLQAPIIASADASFFGVAEPVGLNRLPSLGQHLQGPEYIAWNKLREKDDSRHLSLVMPPFLLRDAYGADHPLDRITFEEAGHLWAGGALAVAVIMADSFVRTGWPTHLHGNGDNRVGGLPVWKSAGGYIPLAALLPERKQAELADAGFVVLGCRVNHDNAYVAHAPTLRRAGSYESAEATEEIRAHLSLPSQLFVARAAQFLLAFQSEVASGSDVAHVQSELSSRLRRLLSASGQEVSAEAVTVERVPQGPSVEHEVLEVRLRPPATVLNESMSLVMRLMVSK